MKYPINKIIFVIEESPEGGYFRLYRKPSDGPRCCCGIGWFPIKSIAKALGASIITQAESTVELHTHVRDAMHCHFDEGQEPSLIRLHFVQDEVIAAPTMRCS
jgi:hypothetical protein